MKHLPIEFADWQSACTPQADKAPPAVGPSVGAGLGGATAFRVMYWSAQRCGESVEIIAHSFEGLQAALLLAISDDEFGSAVVEVVR